jgi:hypothetical protein
MIFVTGYSVGASGGNDYLTVAYEAVGGQPLWARRYDGPIHGEDVGVRNASSPDGTRVFVTGYSDGIGTGEDFATIAYDASSGATLWCVGTTAAETSTRAP